MDRKARGRPQGAAAAPAPAINRDDRIRALRGVWSSDFGTDALIADRRRERDLEERRAARP